MPNSYITHIGPLGLMQQPSFVNGLVSHNIVPPEMDGRVKGEYKLHRRLPNPIEFILELGVLL